MVAGSNPVVPTLFLATVAQLVEQRIRNAWVSGSSPLGGSIFQLFRDVAQPGSVQRSGRWGRWFESSHPDFACRSLGEGKLRLDEFLGKLCRARYDNFTVKSTSLAVAREKANFA